MNQKMAPPKPNNLFMTIYDKLHLLVMSKFKVYFNAGTMKPSFTYTNTATHPFKVYIVVTMTTHAICNIKSRFI